MSRIVVGMSGGVDSSVAAYILTEQGHDVTGVFMKNWDEKDDQFCTAQQDYEDAKSVCLRLGIPFYAVDFTKEYWDRVFRYFLDEYKKSRTPNPDILCNSEIKFKCFWEYARDVLQAEKIATGHYARTVSAGGRTKLFKGADESKDQSYFLSFLTEQQLKTALFPLGGMMKSEVRKIAESLKLRTADKKDSTGICFIGERNFTRFLMNYIPAQKGDIADADTRRIIGKHNGLMYYTIGQRRGLGIGGTGTGERWYVCGKDTDNNILYAVQGADNPKLFVSGLTAENWNFINPPEEQDFRCSVKIRYRQSEKACSVSVRGEHGTVVFDEPQSGAAPGQAAVFYDGEECLGGAIIGSTLK